MGLNRSGFEVGGPGWAAVQVVAVLDHNPVAVQRLRSGPASRSRPWFRLWWLRAWIQRPAAGAVVEFGEHTATSAWQWGVVSDRQWSAVRLRFLAPAPLGMSVGGVAPFKPYWSAPAVRVQRDSVDLVVR